MEVLKIFSFITLMLIISNGLIAQKNEPKWLLKEKKERDQTYEMLKKKFAFSTGCDISEVKATTLVSLADLNKYYCDNCKSLRKAKVTPRTIGLEGCDKKQTFELVPLTGWVLNSSSEQEKN